MLLKTATRVKCLYPNRRYLRAFMMVFHAIIIPLSVTLNSFLSFSCLLPLFLLSRCYLICQIVQTYYLFCNSTLFQSVSFSTNATLLNFPTILLVFLLSLYIDACFSMLLALLADAANKDGVKHEYPWIFKSLWS